ncbi:MAG: VOC family protein [Proteobacteria bacterium]|nr:VOC family protein [Pseudomonadota bacterium]
MDTGGVGTAPDRGRAGHLRLSLLGRFLEIGIQTPDIRASVEFYERLGFTQARTGDIWPHPYGVLTDGRAHIGLHQKHLDSPALTFVRPEIAGQLGALERAGVQVASADIGSEAFHQVGFRDPAGQEVRLLEARTYSPADRSASQTSRCGAFAWLSLPAADFEPVRGFWERLGLQAQEERERPFAHLPLRGAGVELALHRPRFFTEPLLVFRDADMAARIARLRELGIGPLERPPRGLDASANALLTAPEGTVLALLEGRGEAEGPA